VVEPWYEIVGVVENLDVNRLDPSRVRAVVYHPAPPDRLGPSGATLLVRVRGDDPASYVARFREIAGSVDSALKLNGVGLLARGTGVPRVLLVLGSAVLAVLVAVIGLSTAGIHALMSFTVTRQRREIGIRAALGAQPRRLLAAIFARAVLQVGTGVVIGAAMALRLLTKDGSSPARAAIFLGIVALLTLGVGLACRTRARAPRAQYSAAGGTPQRLGSADQAVKTAARDRQAGPVKPSAAIRSVP
jgi:hypothetical protein